MFVIIGANGNTGRVAAETLIEGHQAVRVVLRDERTAAAWQAKSAEVVHGSLEDVASLERAFVGARGVYLLLPPDNASNDTRTRARRLFGNVAQALTQAKVPHVVLLSSISAQHADGNGPIAALHIGEQILGAIPGLARTFLRASSFLENHAAVLGAVTGHGILPTFLPADLTYAQISTADIGRFAAKALVEPATAGETRVWNLAGAVDASERDVAAVIGAILGREIPVVENPLAAVVPTFTGFGLSEHVAGLYREMYEGIVSGHIAFVAGEPVLRGSEGPREVLGRMLAG